MKFFRQGRNGIVAILLNVAGLSFAFAALYVIMVQVHYDLRYNYEIKDSDRIYLLTIHDWYEEGMFGSYLNRPTSEQIINGISSIESGGTISPYGMDIQVYLDDDTDPVAIKSSQASVDGLKTLGYELLEGDWEDLTPGQTLAVSASTSKRLSIHAGDILKIGSTEFYSQSVPTDVKIAAVYKDLPVNSDLSLHDAVWNIGDMNIDNYSEWSYQYFIKLKDSVTAEQINKELDDYLFKTLTKENGLSPEEAETWIKDRGFKLFPIRDIYFNPLVKSLGQKGNKTTTLSLLGIAILIIIIAFINYINFFFAMVPVRLRGINTRKILGSSRSRLVFSLISESIIFVIIALGLGAVWVIIFSHSSYSGIISPSVIFSHNWGMTFITIGVAIFIAGVSSISPALYLTSFNPALALKGALGKSVRGNVFRTSLIGLQFTISLILVVCAIFINMQRNFMLNHDLGFDRENLLTAEVSMTLAQKREIIENRMKENPLVEDITWAYGPIIANSRMGWGRSFNGQTINFEVYPVAWNFLRFMKIPVEEGRDFTPYDEENENGFFIVNEDAKEKFGFKVGDRFSGHRGDENPAEIIGFSKNFNYMPLRSTGGAFSFYMFGKYSWSPFKQLYVRTIPGANPSEVKDMMIELFSELDPERHKSLWNVETFGNSIEYLYAKEKNLSKLVNMFTFLAIIISLMGVFGLVMFDTEYRKKEIGIRRVNGATVGEILSMLNMKFIKIVIISFIIALPVSWWIISVYLESYAYRTPIYIWVFFVAFLAVLTITVGVVTIRSFRAATSNPIEALRTE